MVFFVFKGLIFLDFGNLVGKTPKSWEKIEKGFKIIHPYSIAMDKKGSQVFFFSAFDLRQRIN